MVSDLPDYTRLVTVNVNIPEVQVGPVNVGRYQSAPADLPDGTRAPILTDIKGRVIVVTWPGLPLEVTQLTRSNMQVEAVARPKGGIRDKGSVTTTGAYQTLVSRTVTNGKTFQLAKILISCSEDVQYKLRWGGSDISAEIIVPANTPWTDWFPWEAYDMDGDGTKAFDIQVKYPSGGYAASCYAEYMGEEV